MQERPPSLIQYFKDQHILKHIGNKQKKHLKHIVEPTLGVEFPPVKGCSGYIIASCFRDVVMVWSFGRKKNLGENQSLSQSMYFSSVDSLLSNIPDPPVSVSECQLVGHDADRHRSSSGISAKKNWGLLLLINKGRMQGY